MKWRASLIDTWVDKHFCPYRVQLAHAVANGPGMAMWLRSESDRSATRSGMTRSVKLGRTQGEHIRSELAPIADIPAGAAPTCCTQMRGRGLRSKRGLVPRTHWPVRRVRMWAAHTWPLLMIA
jgi:hypothetical protein